MKLLYIITILITFISNTSKAQIVNIPDTNFLNALIDLGVDINADGLISYTEAEVITEINVYGKNISDITGIESFTNLIELNCGLNLLTNINLSENTQLVWLDCSKNNLNNINITNCNLIEHINCSNNNLSNIDLSSNPNIIFFSCKENILSNLDITNCTLIEELYCYINLLTTLDLQYNLDLRTLLIGCEGSSNPYLVSNLIESMDISNNEELEIIDLSKLPYLTDVCVWELPFPTDSVSYLYTDYSPNINFTTDCISNVEETILKNINIYPNPAKDKVQITVNNEQLENIIEITDINGKILKQITMNHEQFTIDLKDFDRGVYIIKISNNKSSVSQKIILK